MKFKNIFFISIIIFVCYGVCVICIHYRRFKCENICKQFVKAAFYNSAYYLFVSSGNNRIQSFSVDYKTLISKYKLLKEIREVDFCSYTDVDFKLVNEDLLVVSGLGNIFYLNVKTSQLLRHIKMPSKTSICFDIIEDKDIIFTFQNDIYVYYYNFDKIVKLKNENNVFKDILDAEKHNFHNIPKMAYSKKSHSILYSTIIKEDDYKHKLFLIDLNMGKISFVAEGTCPQVNNNGDFYYAYKNIIFEYDISRKQIKKKLIHKKRLFDYTDKIEWYKIIDNVVFIVSLGKPDFKDFYPSILFIYTNKERFKLTNNFLKKMDIIHKVNN